MRTGDTRSFPKRRQYLAAETNKLGDIRRGEYLGVLFRLSKSLLTNYCEPSLRKPSRRNEDLSVESKGDTPRVHRESTTVQSKRATTRANLGHDNAKITLVRM